MDPLSAFALAGTVYTFIDAGITVTKFAKELREFWKSSRDTTENVGQLTVTTENLEALSSELRDVNEPQYLKSIAAECTTLCLELSGLLKKLRVKDKKSWTEHLSVTVSAYRKKDKISSIEERLGKLREQMAMDLLRAMKDGQSDIKKVLDDVQNDISKLSAVRSETFQQQRTELLDLLRAHEKNRQDDNSVLINKLQEFRSGVLDERIQNQILLTLRFDGMYSREDSTSAATEGTFQWLISADQRFEKEYVRDSRLVDKMRVAREAFLAWLQLGDGVFHVCGKAGSGKSTLMKLICRDNRTRYGLNTWAGNQTLLYASFFFYDPGEKKAKSLEGLYQCVLFTILNEHRDLMKKVYPDEFDHDRQPSLQFFDLIRPPKLEKAIQSLITMTNTGPYKMCIFIDGLDEYEGNNTDYWELAERLSGWADQGPNTKFCVSSRPEVQFVKTFGPENATSLRQIHLQEFTSGDIEKHCHDQFAKSSRFPSSDIVPNYDKFIDHIVARSQGVFLWAVLVTKLLLHETRTVGFERDLWRRLEEIPDDINALYQKLFDSLGDAQRRKCHRILLAVLTNPFEQSLNIRCLNWIFDADGLDHISLGNLERNTFGSAERQVNRVTDHLSEWTRGLVETITWRRATEGEPSSIINNSGDASSRHSLLDGSDISEFHDIGGEEGSLPGNFDDKSLQELAETNQYEYNGLVNGGRRTIERSPLFETRVRLFHRTLKDYMLEPARFCELQSDCPEFDLVNTHAKLRLLELDSVSDRDQAEYSTDLHEYGYSILRMNVEHGLGSQNQVSWSVCKAIGLLIPTKGFCRPSRLHQLFNPPPEPTKLHVGLDRRIYRAARPSGTPLATLITKLGPMYDQTVEPRFPGDTYYTFDPTDHRTDEQWFTGDTEAMSFPHFAAFFGHPEFLRGQDPRRSLPGPMKDDASMPPERNLLLSACFGSIILSGSSIHAGASIFREIITGLLDLGYSGRDLVRLEAPLEWELGKGATVWQLLILALCCLEPLPSQVHVPSSVDQLLKVLAQILESEPQDEVWILVHSRFPGKLFDSFVTIHDVVESLYPSDSRNSLLCQLDGREQSTLEEPQRWMQRVFEVHNPLGYALAEDLQRLSPHKYKQWGKKKRIRMQPRMPDIAVVSKRGLLVGNSVWRAILTVW